MRQVIDVGHDIILILWEFLETELEDSERDLLVFAAIVFHEGGGAVHVELSPVVFSSLLEHFTSRFDSFGSPRELHILNVCLRITEKLLNVT